MVFGLPQAIGDYVRHFANQLSMETGGPPAVKTVANLVAQVRLRLSWMLLSVRVNSYQ